MAETLTRPRVFLDIQIGTQPTGRLVIELFSDKTPRTCENFRALCTSSHIPHGASKALTYKLSTFHRIIDEFMIQGGDITAGSGTGGQSIYGATFADENIGWREMDAEGLVCMANRGMDTNSSQFFITLAPCQHLNAKHTIFGHVVTGKDIVKRMAEVDVDKSDKPLEPVIVTSCGELERRKKPIAATPDASERGRKRAKTSRQTGRSSTSHSKTSSPSQNRHEKHHRRNISPRPPSKKTIRRRSDVQIDETRRGRVLTRSPSSSAKNKKPLSPRGQDSSENQEYCHHPRNRKRSPSPSRSRSHHDSPSPHLRRRRTRPRDRSPLPRKQRRRHDEERRADEYQIRREEMEREGGEDRYQDVIDEGYGAQRNGWGMEYERVGRATGGQYSSSGRLGAGGGGESSGGEVKFKGRGSMKYREKKW